jgi:hypothetical protein
MNCWISNVDPGLATENFPPSLLERKMEGNQIVEVKIWILATVRFSNMFTYNFFFNCLSEINVKNKNAYI